MEYLDWDIQSFRQDSTKSSHPCRNSGKGPRSSWRIRPTRYRWRHCLNYQSTFVDINLFKKLFDFEAAELSAVEDILEFAHAVLAVAALGLENGGKVLNFVHAGEVAFLDKKGTGNYFDFLWWLFTFFLCVLALVWRANSRITQIIGYNFII